MSTPEAKVKDWISKTMKEWYPDAFKYMPAGGFYGKSGMPDFLFITNGVLICIEAKAEGGHATDLQVKTLKKLRDCGAIVAIVTGKDIVKMLSIKRQVDERISI
jgi:hypothetical protein